MARIKRATFNDRYSIFFWRAAFYVLLVAFLGIFNDLLFSGESFTPLSNVFALISCVAVLQLIFVFQRTWPEQMLALFLTDSAVTMLLVRETGGSASPFTLLFPVVSLCGAITLDRRSHSWLLISMTIAMMSFSVGLRPAIIGNALAILGTTLLGQYLLTKLQSSDHALELSEGARRRLENIQKAILTNIPNGLMSVDTFGRVIQVNHVGASILEQAESYLMGHFLRDILPELDQLREGLHTMFPVVGDLNERSLRRIVEYKTPSGKTLKLGYSLARLNDPEDRSPLGTLVVFQDLTHEYQIEEELRLSEKLAAVGKLAAGIAHEIRNPLAGISGSAEMLEGSSHLEAEDKQLLGIIKRESQRLDSLITEFLNYVRPASPQIESINLQAVVADVVESLNVNPLFRSGNCKILMAENTIMESWVLADRNKLVQILINLIINSAQAQAKHVTIEFGINTVSVWDDGSGIPSENIKRLFEPFFTTKERGTGLGLALSYKLLEAMGGSVKVQSPLPDVVEHGGTRFTIELKGANSRNESAAV